MDCDYCTRFGAFCCCCCGRGAGAITPGVADDPAGMPNGFVAVGAVPAGVVVSGSSCGVAMSTPLPAPGIGARGATGTGTPPGRATRPGGNGRGTCGPGSCCTGVGS